MTSRGTCEKSGTPSVEILTARIGQKTKNTRFSAAGTLGAPKVTEVYLPTGDYMTSPATFLRVREGRTREGLSVVEYFYVTGALRQDPPLRI